MVPAETTGKFLHSNHTIHSDVMIRLQNIEKVYRTDTVETLALNDVSLNINK